VGGGVVGPAVVGGDVVVVSTLRGEELGTAEVGALVCVRGGEVRRSDEPSTGVLGVTLNAALAALSDPLVSRCSAKTLFTPPSAVAGTVNVV
jgi:hypothetical protein